jgi:hypothetical protein
LQPLRNIIAIILLNRFVTNFIMLLRPLEHPFIDDEAVEGKKTARTRMAILS